MVSTLSDEQGQTLTHPTKIMMGFPELIVPLSALSQNTVASSECANDSAHNRRYDAVLDTVPAARKDGGGCTQTHKHRRKEKQRQRDRETETE